MSVQPNTSPAPGRGNTQAAEDTTSAGTQPPPKSDEQPCSPDNPAPPLPSQAPPVGHNQPGADPEEGYTLVSPEQKGRVEAPQFKLEFEESERLPVSGIHADPDVQVRARMDDDAIKDYAEHMRAGALFPPIIVFEDTERLWLADGFHRLEAARQARLKTISAIVKPGGRREAIRHALGANVCHGLRRTNADKRRAVEIALKEFADLSDRNLADLCGVGNALVGDVRKQVCDSNTSTPRTGRDGKQYAPKKSAAEKHPAVGKQPVVKVNTPPAPDSSSQAAGLQSKDNVPSGNDTETARLRPADGTPAPEQARTREARVANQLNTTEETRSPANTNPSADESGKGTAAEDMIPSEKVEHIVAGVTRSSVDRLNYDLVPLIQHLVPEIAAVLNKAGKQYPEETGKDLAHAASFATTKIQAAMKWL